MPHDETRFDLGFNSNYSFDFSGGNLSPGGGLLQQGKFLHKVALLALALSRFPRTDRRIHRAVKILLQQIYSRISGRHVDSAVKYLKADDILTRLLGKDALASQASISHFFNNLDGEDITKLQELLQQLFLMANPPGSDSSFILDIDIKLLDAYGAQKESSFNAHYPANGYLPLLFLSAETGYLLSLQLPSESVSSVKGIRDFLEPTFQWMRKTYGDIPILLRGESGFAFNELYLVCEEYKISYNIELKSSGKLRDQLRGVQDEAWKKLAEELAADIDAFKEMRAELQAEATRLFIEKYGYYNEENKTIEEHYEVMYQAKSWSKARRVVCCITREVGQFTPECMFTVTSPGTLPDGASP
ncbi:MAG: transposase [Bacillota bacterium]|nr:transposase [Bacillota bacterium]